MVTIYVTVCLPISEFSYSQNYLLHQFLIFFTSFFGVVKVESALTTQKRIREKKLENDGGDSFSSRNLDQYGYLSEMKNLVFFYSNMYVGRTIVIYFEGVI